MASNEEILKQAIPNFDNKDLPKFRVVFSRDFSDNVSQKILSSMDAARKDEAVAVLEYLLKGRFQCDDTNYFRAYNGVGSHQFTPIELYTIFKKQNS